MKILGFNIGKAQEYEERKGRVLGDSGTDNYEGIITEEYNSKLAQDQGVKVYDEMRRSDGTVHSIVLVTSLPIRRASWYINPASEDTKDQEIAEFIEKALFEELELSWDDFLRQALLMLPFGVMPFEKVFATRDDGKIVWYNFAPRLPKSIVKWQLDNGKLGMQQLKRDGTYANIPMEKLLLFVNEQEGTDFWGKSILRAAYKHWYFKNSFYKIDAMAFERQGLGVLEASYPPGMTKQELDDMEKYLKNIRANQNAYLMHPEKFEVQFMDMNAKSTRDPENSIKHHNREITKSVLAQFLELGASESGSRALSSDHTELFLKSMEAVANNIKGVLDKAIRELVDLNFSGVENYPTLEYSDIQKTDVSALAVAYQTLTTSGALTVTEKDEQFFRGVLGLPEVTEEELADIKEEKEEELDRDLNIETEKETVKKKDKVESHEIAVKIKDRIAPMGYNEALAFIRQKLHTLSTLKTEHSRFYHEVRLALTARKAELEKKRFEENNRFDGWRPLTFAERKVNLKGIQETLDDMEDSFQEEGRAILAEAKQGYVKRLGKLLEQGDTKTMQEVEMKGRNAYESMVGKKTKASYEFGKVNAAREMNVKAPATPDEATAQLALAAAVIADQTFSSIENDAKQAIVTSLEKDVSNAQAMGAVDKQMDEKILEKTRDTAAIVLAGNMNVGRRLTFTAYEDDIYAYQRSEILDGRVCNYCLSMDGRLIETDDRFAKTTIYHSNCRGLWVSILQDEQEKPKVTGIPNSIRDRFGDTVNDLIQPRKPIVRKDSLATKFLKNRGENV